jgi:hypothetical protein
VLAPPTIVYQVVSSYAMYTQAPPRGDFGLWTTGF